MRQEIISTDGLTAFVAMCFDERLSDVYHKVVRPVLEEQGFKCIRADEICKNGVIIEQICEQIDQAQLVVCDLTFENPNVFYELGIAHNLKKVTILLSQAAANIPFDVRHLRTIQYNDSRIGLVDLRTDFVKYLRNLKLTRANEKVEMLAPEAFCAPPDELEVQRSNLYSKNLEMKRYAVKFLGDHADKQSFQQVLLCVRHDPNEDIKRDGVQALFKINRDNARQFLLDECLRYQTSFLVRETTVILLGNLVPDEELLEQMYAQSTDTSWGVRRAVCEVLGKWARADTGALSRLQEMKHDPETPVRLAAEDALRKLDLTPKNRRLTLGSPSPAKETSVNEKKVSIDDD